MLLKIKVNIELIITFFSKNQGAKDKMFSFLYVVNSFVNRHETGDKFFHGSGYFIYLDFN